MQLLIVSIASPLLIGVYMDGILAEEHSVDGKASSMLLPTIADLLGRYEVEEMIYTRGPGSYMAIKLTYIMLKTIETLRGIRVSGCSAFEANGGKPIKAIGNLYFIKEKETIITKKFSEPQAQIFRLPHSLESVAVDEDASPEYHLCAV